jgi:hypothetical protein
VTWVWQVAIILGMFFLRLGVPLLIILAVGYWLRRLDAKWQAEAVARQAASQMLNNTDITPPLEMFQVIEISCWVFNDCPEAIRSQCPAFQQPDLPCWLARQRAEGRIPARCYNCELFVTNSTRNQVTGT